MLSRIRLCRRAFSRLRKRKPFQICSCASKKKQPNCNGWKNSDCWLEQDTAIQVTAYRVEDAVMTSVVTSVVASVATRGVGQERHDASIFQAQKRMIEHSSSDFRNTRPQNRNTNAIGRAAFGAEHIV